jgi:hypothetical protein
MPAFDFNNILEDNPGPTNAKAKLCWGMKKLIASARVNSCAPSG